MLVNLMAWGAQKKNIVYLYIYDKLGVTQKIS